MLSQRDRVTWFVIVGMVMIPVLATAQTSTITRTAWGDPDLESVWDYRTVTPLQRPEDQLNKEFLSEEEAASIEQELLARNADLLTREPQRTSASNQVDRREDGSPGFYNNFWLDRGTTTVGTRRTSLIVDPPNGRLPGMTPDAQRRADSEEAKRIADVRRGARPARSWTDLDAGDRCIQHAKAGPPISVGGYNNNVQIFQVPGYVALLNEQNHDVRIIPLDGRSHVGSQILQWMGLQPNFSHYLKFFLYI